MKCSNIGDQVEINPYWFHDAAGKYKLQLELLILKNCNSLLVNWIINLKKHIVQCSVHRNKMVEINLVPHSLNSVDLEEKVCEALSLTGIKLSWKMLMPVTEWKRKTRRSSSLTTGGKKLN